MMSKEIGLSIPKSSEKPLRTLVTGAAGFIGYHLSLRFLRAGYSVVGLDCLNDYYDIELKKNRLAQLQDFPGFKFAQLDMADREAMKKLFETEQFDRVVNLAAQAGVRYSITNPHAYIDSNLVGFTNILEGCRSQKVPHLVFASSSSVYGLNTRMPFSVSQNVDHPVSLYAATKKANELMAHSYSHLFRLPTTGLRFFTVYGPWGRPDMALFLFTKAICEGKPIKVFNYGNMQRDFTYINDIIQGVAAVCESIPEPDPEWSGDDPKPHTSPAPYRLFNIGNNNPVKLMEFIEAIEEALGRKAEKELLPIQPGDVPVTCADVDNLEEAVGFRPMIGIREGIGKFIEWYKEYYKV